jgi:5'-deoxynucleotidase YfbR-like HD superfamily hydrolase
MQETSQLERKNILKEVDRLLYTYGLNKVIRFGKKRKEKHQTQSVAEHVTNMLFCAYYFRELESLENQIKFDEVVKIIMMHDMGEIESGDIITTQKTNLHILKERKAIKKVKKKSPEFVARDIERIFDAFEWPNTIEGRFAKAIDKFEGMLFWSTNQGIKMIKTFQNKKTIKNYFINLEKILQNLGFKYIHKYMVIIRDDMIKRGVLK